jgi:hypothetical protein
LSITICYQPVKVAAKTVDSKLVFFDTLRRVVGCSGYANEFIVGQTHLDHLRIFLDSLENDSVDYRSTSAIIKAVEAYGDVRVWGSFEIGE